MFGSKSRSGTLWGAVALLAVLNIILAGCGTSRPTPSRPRPEATYPRSGKSYVINGQRYYILASAKGYSEEGDASWYGRDFHGRKTSSGERYNMYDLTAAHKTLPLNTWVKVINLENHRDVTVRINDRGPFVRGRIIDLSFTGARELGMAEAGTAQVRIEALGTAEERIVNGRPTTVLVQPDNYTEGRFAIQVGSFKNQENARNLMEKLGRVFGPVNIVAFDRGDAVFYRVQVADEPNLERARDLQTRLESHGFRDCFVVAR
ncbi:MAG: septal ring lytic transglycosylase RlpA family protein [Thermodesulfobacteriota bacterium]